MADVAGPSDSTKNMIEDNFSRFKLNFLVGQGTFSNVYKATDTVRAFVLPTVTISTATLYFRIPTKS